jgi:integrase
MNGKAVTLMIRYKDDTGTWRRSPAVRGGNGKVKPNCALVNGRAVDVSGGAYELRHTIERKTVYAPAGTKPAVADAKRIQLEKTKAIIAQAAGNPDVEVSERSTERPTLKDTAVAYIKDAEGRNALEAAAKSKLVTVEFINLMQSKKKLYVDQIVKSDLYAYHAAVRARGCGDRTAANNHQRVASWLRFAGIAAENIPAKPRYEEKLPTIYTSEQIRKLLDVVDCYMRICMLLALKCGLRDQELMHLEFSDINWEEKTLRIRAKEKWNFKPKRWEQRDIPIPEGLLEELREWQNTRPGQTLVLGTTNRTPSTHLLRTFKRLAYRTGLNCGICDSCQTSHECGEYTLHEFRRTYITTLLRNGIDLRTVQAYAGHKKLESTMRYLRPVAASEAHDKLNAVKW